MGAARPFVTTARAFAIQVVALLDKRVTGRLLCGLLPIVVVDGLSRLLKRCRRERGAVVGIEAGLLEPVEVIALLCQRGVHAAQTTPVRLAALLLLTQCRRRLSLASLAQGHQLFKAVTVRHGTISLMRCRVASRSLYSVAGWRKNASIAACCFTASSLRGSLPSWYSPTCSNSSTSR